MEQIPLVVPIAPDGVAPSNVVSSPEIQISLEALREDGKKWAEECGLKPPFNVQGPDRIDYPQRGYGYQMTVREAGGKQRLGSARFTSAGVRSYWSIDGIVTG